MDRPKSNIYFIKTFDKSAHLLGAFSAFQKLEGHADVTKVKINVCINLSQKIIEEICLLSRGAASVS